MVQRSYRSDEIVVHWVSDLRIHGALCDLSHRPIGFLNNPRVVLADRENAESPQDIDPMVGP